MPSDDRRGRERSTRCNEALQVSQRSFHRDSGNHRSLISSFRGAENSCFFSNNTFHSSLIRFFEGSVWIVNSVSRVRRLVYSSCCTTPRATIAAAAAAVERRTRNLLVVVIKLGVKNRLAFPEKSPDNRTGNVNQTPSVFSDPSHLTLFAQPRIFPLFSTGVIRFSCAGIEAGGQENRQIAEEQCRAEHSSGLNFSASLKRPIKGPSSSIVSSVERRSKKVSTSPIGR